jgi:predicted peptidase
MFMKYHQAKKVLLLFVILFTALYMALYYLLFQGETKIYVQKDIFLREWYISKSYSNTLADSLRKTSHGIHCYGFNHDFLNGGETDKNFKSSGWIHHQSKTDVVDFTHIFDSTNFKVAYAFSTFYSDENKEMLLAVGSDDGIKIWFNGEFVHENHVGRGTHIDDDFIPVRLQKGVNTCLIKVDNGDGGWGFIARFREKKDVLEYLSDNVKEFWFSPLTNYTMVVGESLKLNPPNVIKISLFPKRPKCIVEIIMPDGKQKVTSAISLNETQNFSIKLTDIGLYDLIFHITVENRNEIIIRKEFFVGNLNKELNNLWNRTSKLLQKNKSNQFEISWRGNLERLDTLIHGARGISKRERSMLVVRQIITLYDLLRYNNEGTNALKHKKGSFIRGYLSQIDNSFQYYQLYVPSTYDSKKTAPVMFHLHGQYERDMPFMNSNEINWVDAVEKREALGEKYGCIVVWPYGRGNALYSGVGQEDLPIILSELKADYAIDTSKICLVSYSKGATAALNNIMRFPNLYTAVAAIAPFTDYRIDQRSNVDVPKSHPYHFFLDANNPSEIVQNLSNKSVLLLHGLDDKYSSIENSRSFYKRLKQFGVSVAYKELPNSNHFNYFVDPEPMVYQWLHELPQPEQSSVTTYRTAQLKYHQAEGISIVRLDSVYRYGEITADILNDSAISVTAKNIIEYRLEPLRLIGGTTQQGTIVTNNAPSFSGSFLSVPLITVNGNVDSTPTRQEKSSAIEGPINHMYSSKFIVVYGVSGTRKENEINRREAESFAREWYKRFFTKVSVKSDAEVTDADIATAHLLLIGVPASNRLIKKILPSLPFSLTSNGLIVGKHTFRSSDAGIRAIYPNPLQSGKYVSVFTGVTSDAIQHSIERFGIDGWYDIMVYDERTIEDKRSVNLIGFFDHDWKVNDGLLYAR